MEHRNDPKSEPQTGYQPNQYPSIDPLYRPGEQPSEGRAARPEIGTHQPAIGGHLVRCEQPGQASAATNQPVPGDKKAIWSLVFGLLSIGAFLAFSLSLFGFLSLSASIVFGLIGLFLAARTTQRNQHAIPTLGLVLSIIGIVLSILAVLFVLILSALFLAADS